MEYKNLTQVVLNAKLIMQVIYEMKHSSNSSDLKLRHNIEDAWSITYIEKTNSYHLYTHNKNGSGVYCIKLVENKKTDEKDFYYSERLSKGIVYKRVSKRFMEGKSSIILCYNDCAVGNSNWDTSDYYMFCEKYHKSPYFAIN